jgi:prolyl-tRNA synthetase
LPIFKNDDEKSMVMPVVERIADSLLSVSIRLHVDAREELTPGFKFNDWEMRGVPLRMEVGPKDVANQSVALGRRDVPGKEGKQFVPQEGIIATVTRLLNDIQHNMLHQAKTFRDANLHEVKDYDTLKKIGDDGWALLWHCGTAECEDRIKEDTKASSRCFPLDLNKDEKPKDASCAICGKPAQGKAYFAKAY